MSVYRLGIDRLRLIWQSVEVLGMDKLVWIEESCRLASDGSIHEAQWGGC